LRSKTNISYIVPGPAIFGVKKYANMLDDLATERNINVQTKKVLIKIDSNKKIATYESKIDGKITEESYDLLHVTPPMFAPDFIKDSPFADATGYASVDKITLQSVKYPNTFAIGDCSNSPNSKTFAAISSQAPVVVHNIQKVMKNEKPDGKYNGYASCPLINSKNKLILAEFGYGGKILETFSRDSGKFPYSLIGQTGYFPEMLFCWLKTTGFPLFYWNLWLKGRWYGTNGIIKPDVTIDTINEPKK
jgi:sulfide:quinone oxidoreductase